MLYYQSLEDITKLPALFEIWFLLNQNFEEFYFQSDGNAFVKLTCSVTVPISWRSNCFEQFSDSCCCHFGNRFSHFPTPFPPFVRCAAKLPVERLVNNNNNCNNQPVDEYEPYIHGRLLRPCSGGETAWQAKLAEGSEEVQVRQSMHKTSLPTIYFVKRRVGRHWPRTRLSLNWILSARNGVPNCGLNFWGRTVGRTGVNVR